MINLLDYLLDEAGLWLEPIAGAAEDQESQLFLFDEINWSLDEIPDFPLSDLGQRLTDIAQKHEKLSSTSNILDAFTRLNELLDSIREIYTVLPPDKYPPISGFAEQYEKIGDDLLNHYFIDYLDTWHPTIFQFFILAVIIRLDTAPLPALVDTNNNNIIRFPYSAPEFDFAQLTKVFTDPTSILTQEYFEPDSLVTLDAAKETASVFFPRLGNFLNSMGAGLTYNPNINEYDFPNNGTEETGAGMLLLDLSSDVEDDGFGLVLTLSHGEGSDLGVVFIPFGNLAFTGEIGNWQVDFAGEAAAGGVAIDPRDEYKVNLLTGKSGQINLSLGSISNTEYPLILIGSRGGSHFVIENFKLGSQIKVEGTTPQLAVLAESGPTSLVVQDVIRFGWEGMRLALNGNFLLEFSRLNLSIEALPPELAIEANLRLAFKNGDFQPAHSRLEVLKPDLADLGLENFYIDHRCVALQWQEPNINRWLKHVAADFFERNSPVESTVIMRALYNPTQEIRLDWEVAGTPRSFGLPGLIRVKTPDQGRFSLIFGAGDQSLDNVALLFTLEKDAKLTLECTFTWGTSGERELHNDPTPDQQSAEPLIAVDLVAKNDISLLLTSFGVTAPALPTFFKQLAAPPADMFDNGQLASPDNLCSPTNLTYKDFTIDDWKPKLRLNLEKLDNFTLPFLTDGSSQFIKIGKPKVEPIDKPETEPDKFNDDGTISIRIPITVCVGPLEFESGMLLKFDLATFAFQVTHTEGIKLVTKDELLPADKAEFLGLSWQSQGILITQDGKEKYHHFTLVTQNYDYKIIQPPGASFELGFSGISKDSVLKFKTTKFELGPNGISLETEVLDDPVHLLGIDTKFSFEGTSLKIKNNKIEDFELKGTGPLPPALVGDAVAEIRLNFGQRGGGLKLIDGDADLEFDKPLKCEGTRFEFSVSKLGLSFYDDGKFHLYFLVSGKARFILAPGDDDEGALGWLPNIELELVECPLTGDASVIANHVNFLIELPKKVSFNFLGCFEMELRGIGFVPQAKPFDGDGAMRLTGQLKFAKGLGDVSNPRVDYHTLLIGLPEPGKFVPRIYFEQIALNLSLGDAFTLRGTVKFYDDDTRKGFEGVGELALPGMPSLEVILGFMRVRENPTDPWARAWFIFAQVKRLSVGIPAIPIIYLREIGLGFGYRYTLTSIKTADETNDIKKLLTELKVLSRTQGNLATFEAWSVDLEQRGTDPRWTIVLRGMVSQSSASASPADWNPIAEQPISCLYLFDAVIAFRSDFTFFMAVRGWINHNYYDYTTNADNIQNNPFFSGFVLLSPKQKRFLAHVASNPDGKIGSKPELAEFIKKALESIEFSATLLIEPGLLHYELGWPNNLRWETKLGPIKVGIEGGFIFRLTEEELLIGSSFAARGELKIKKKYSVGIAGVSIDAYAYIAYGTRYIGVISFDDPFGDSMYYYGAGLEFLFKLSLKAWLGKGIFKVSGRFSVHISFTGGFEFGIEGVNLPGIRGKGTVALKVYGRGLRFSVEFGINEEVIEKIEDRIQGYLAMGLEGSDGAYLPGVDPRTGDAEAAAATGQISRRNGQPSRTIKRALPTEIGISALSAAEEPPPFQVPGYSLFTIHEAEADPDHIYFVLLPQGERLEDKKFKPERGFLPVPPQANVTVTNDFSVVFPADGQFVLKHFNPMSNDWSDVAPETEHKWKINWEAGIFPYTPTDGIGQPIPGAKEERLTLAQYMRFAFRYQDGDSFDVNPIGDPVLPENQVTLQDERVHNPSDAAFEAAVRGAYEQFKGSPYFKPDPNLEYDRVLREAFKPATSIYEPGVDEGNQDTHPTDEQADQLRGVIIQDIIADLRDYAHKYANRSDEEKNDFTKDSIAFQMGLVFRVKKLTPEEEKAGKKYPTWFDQIGATNVPTIKQRNDPGSSDIPPAPDNEDDPNKKEIRPFNTTQTSFDTYPPKFERVRHYTSANTVGIAWDLTWDQAPDTNCTPCQADPEHHLLHYHVRRRSLDSQERERIFTVKPAEAVHRENGTLNYLKPRFNLVDNFNHESDEEQANLPANGRSYLYTITPVDFAGTRGRPLSVVATRFPDKPPQVPVDGEFVVRYRLTEADLESSATLTPRLIKPVQAHIAWTRPKPPKTGPLVPIGKYCLIFRRKNTLPIGSYGLDSSFQGSPVKSLPTSNARPLPTDIKIMVDVDPDAQNIVRGGGDNRIYATVSIGSLQAARIIPPDEAPSGTIGPGDRAAAPFWQPESWVVFFQTISVNGVPSSLAPVQLLLRVEGVPAGKEEILLSAEALANLDPRDALPTREERRPAEIEWLPYPLEFPMLPPEDMRAITANAHFPMPESFIFEDVIPNDAATPEGEPKPVNHVTYQPHPAGIRTVRFRWNQGPSNMPDYPLDLNAGYHLLELDIDNHTTETFNNPVKLAEALRQIQEVQMLPPADLLLTPGDTLATSQWEAWYPSAMLRLRQSQADAHGSKTPFGPWYSWRESDLVWPEWPGLTDGAGLRNDIAHPFLLGLVTALRENPLNVDGLKTYNVDLQTGPPMAPKTLLGLVNATPPEIDPYGWGLLQRFGLSITLALRDKVFNEVRPGEETVQAIQGVLSNYSDKMLIRRFSVAQTNFTPDDIRNNFNTTSARKVWKDAFDKMQITLPGSIRTTRVIANEVWDLRSGSGNRSKTYRLRLINEKLIVYEVFTVTEAIKKYLTIDLLFQPGQSVELEETPAESGALLAITQISLRPAIKQRLRYGKLDISGPAGGRLELVFTGVSESFSLINQSDPASGQLEIEPEFAEAEFDENVKILLPKKYEVTLPLNGQTSILFRGQSLPRIIRVSILVNEDDASRSISNDYFVYSDDPTARLEIKKDLRSLNENERQILRNSLPEAYKGVASYDFSLLSAVRLVGPEGGQIELEFSNITESFDLLEQYDTVTKSETIGPESGPIAYQTTLPQTRQTTLLFKGWTWKDSDIKISILLPDALDQTDLDKLRDETVFFDYFTPLDTPTPRLVVEQNLNSATEEKIEKIKEHLPAQYQNIVEYFVEPFYATTAEEFAATDELSSYFTVPVEQLAAQFSRTNSDYGKEWRKFKRYVEALTQVRKGDEQGLSDDERIQLPTSAEEIMEVLPEVLAWQQRFFDASAPVEQNTDGLGETISGPFMATAYPRISTPAYATPDDSGRLKYDHLIEDKWAHTYRYYIRPFHRYQLLLNSFRQSPALFQQESSVITANTLASLGEEFAQPVVDKIKPLQDKVYAGRRALLIALKKVLDADYSEMLAQRIADLAEKTTETVPDLLETIAYFVITVKTLANLREEFAQPVVDKIKPLQDKVYAGRRSLLTALKEVLDADYSETLAQRIADLAEKTTETVPDPTAGGLDVVLERTQPIRSPVVISSQRLDRPSTPENPAPPGKVWEVIVAKHAEQSLIERNQTLVRQLSFRQVAFTLMRRFAYQDWKGLIEAAVGDNHEIMIERVSNELPDDLPGEYTSPNIIDLETADETAQRSLDLPKRLPSFQQGALVLQWDSLPFFYEHRLSLIAQAASVVSPVKDVIQRDFEYLSPKPEETTMEAIKFRWDPDEPYKCTQKSTDPPPDPLEVDGRLVHIRLRSLWDSLPESAQKHWSAENPQKTDYPAKRKYSSLPDLEVVYQIIVTSRGNIEVQAEFFFDFEAKEYKLRQLGQQFLAAIKDPLLAPSATDVAGSPYTLDVTLQQITEIELARSYDPVSLPYPTCGKLYFRPDKETEELRQLVFTGVLTYEDWHNLLLNPIKELSEPSLQTFASRAVSEEVDLSGFEGKLEHPEPTDFVVVWTGGPVKTDPKDPVRSALDDPAKINDAELKEALKSIKNNTTILLSPLPTGRELPWLLRGKLDFSDPKGLRWRGDMSPEEKDALKAYRDEPQFESRIAGKTGPLRRVVKEILDGINEEFSTPYDVPPNPADFPAGNVTLPKFSIDAGVTKWTLRWSGLATDKLDDLETLGRVSGNDFNTYIMSLLKKIREPNKSAPIEDLPSGESFDRSYVKEPLGSSKERSDSLKVKKEDGKTMLIWESIKPITQEDIDWLDLLSSSKFQKQFETARIDLILALQNYEVNTKEVPVMYRISQKNLDDLAIKTKYDRLKNNMVLPKPLEANLIWIGAWNLGPAADEGAIEKRFEVCAPNFAVRVEAITDFATRFETVIEKIRDYRNQLFEFNRPLQEELLDSLKAHLLLGRRLLRSNSPLTAKEIQQLRGDETNRGLFEHLADKQAVNRLYNDWRDRQTLDDLYQDWFSQEIISKALDDAQLAEIPDTLTENLDFPDPTTCALIWRGPLTAKDETTLTSLRGDDLFKQAVARLIEQAREIPEDEEDEIIRVDAPLGLDQIPQIVRGQLQLTIKSDDSAYTGLSWDGILSPQQADSLLTWADLTRQDTVKAAVDNLVNTLPPKEIKFLPPRPTEVSDLVDRLQLASDFPEQFKEQLAEGLQLSTTQLAWVGTLPADKGALNRLREKIVDEDIYKDEFDDIFKTAFGKVVQEMDDASTPSPCVIAVDLEPEQRRPSQEDLPPILKEKLTITGSTLEWKDRVSTVAQREALGELAKVGDDSFKLGIQNILTALEAKNDYSFSPIPTRPEEVPSELKDKLMIGRAVIRYHGMMAKESAEKEPDEKGPAEKLRDKFVSKLDQIAIEKLYAASLQKGLRDKELQIRTRRVNATLSDPAKLTADKLETTDDQPSTQGAG